MHYSPTANPRDPSAESTSTAKGINIESWDRGRLLVNGAYAATLRTRGLTTCEAFLALDEGEVVRRVGSRETRRLKFELPAGSREFYLKRHGAPRWRDHIMPYLHFSRPIFGARPEWDAILKFHAAGIPTMTPVALGELGACSFLMTLALPARCHLIEWCAALPEIESGAGGFASRGPLRHMTRRVAEIARTMHAAGLHHQDFYLNHLLLCGSLDQADVRVIDLGRARQRRRLSIRWIIKDLAQLDFSARGLSCTERMRFLRDYLGRPLQPADRSLIRRVRFKSSRIASHTAKHRL
jgi:heptose I phosphotransferase